MSQIKRPPCYKNYTFAAELGFNTVARFATLTDALAFLKARSMHSIVARYKSRKEFEAFSPEGSCYLLKSSSGRYMGLEGRIEPTVNRAKVFRLTEAALVIETTCADNEWRIIPI